MICLPAMLKATATDEHTELILTPYDDESCDCLDCLIEAEQADSVELLEEIVLTRDLREITELAPTATDTAYRHASQDSRFAFVAVILALCLACSASG